MSANELRLQLELATDIEDWDKVRGITAQLNALAGKTAQHQSWQPGPLMGQLSRSGTDGSNRPGRRRGRHRERSRSPHGGTAIDAYGYQQQQSWGWHTASQEPEENQRAIEFNKTIKHHLQRGDMTAARSSLNEMRYLGVRPTTVTYNELLNFCSKSRDLGGALRVVGEMRQEGLHPNRISASTILKALDEKAPQDIIDQVVEVLRWVAATGVLMRF
jgi:pentatricopeptide repeat protein